MDFEEANPGTAVGRYKFQSEAGHGTFCRVLWAEDGEGRSFAVKAFSKSILDNRDVALFDQHGVTTVPLRTRIEEELRLLRQFQHRHIIQLVEVIDDPARHEYFVVLEGMVGGQLMTWKDELSGYSVVSNPQAVQRHWGEAVRWKADVNSGGCNVVCREVVAAHVMRHLLQAVVYLHAQNVIHKDLKPDNIFLSAPIPAVDPRFVRLLTTGQWPTVAETPMSAEGVGAQDAGVLLGQSSFVIKLGDFNSAAVGTQPDSKIYDAEGTTAFSPPECYDQMDRKGYPGKPRDVWSLGVVLFVMLFGRCPYWATEAIMLQLSIMGEDYALPAGVVSPQAEDLIRKLMNRDASARPSAAEAVEHAWLR